MSLGFPGKLIVFEGIDGSGTTSQSKAINQRLTNSYWTKEPSDNSIGKLTRELLKDLSYNVEPTSMCLLFVADRLQHTREDILPRLKNGQHVLCDRYIWSTLAYQSLYFSESWLIEIHKYDYIQLPTLTLVLDCELNVAEARRKSRTDSLERYDDQEIQAKVKQNYLKLARNFPDRSIVIDANKDFDKVTNTIYKAINKICKVE